MVSVSKGYCLNASSVYPPHLSACQRVTRPPQEITTDVMNRPKESNAENVVRKKIDGGLFVELVGDVAYVLEAPVRFRSERAR